MSQTIPFYLRDTRAKKNALICCNCAYIKRVSGRRQFKCTNNCFQGYNQIENTCEFFVEFKKDEE